MVNEIPYGYCHCGCGNKTNICTESDRSKGWVKGEPQKYIHNHIINYLHRKPTKKYKCVYSPGHSKANNIGYVYEHIIMAEKTLGRSLPLGAVIHHWSNKTDNKKIVICENSSYHALLHAKTKALKNCGKPNFRKCWICGEYDDPINLIMNKKAYSYHHNECRKTYRRERRRCP